MKTGGIFMKERTLIFIKPDGVRRKLVGEILSHYEAFYPISSRFAPVCAVF